MELDISEFEVILKGLIMLDDTNSTVFSEYDVDYKELCEKIKKMAW